MAGPIPHACGDPLNPTRVAYVLPHGDLGGAELATIRMMEAHDRSRYEPVCLLFGPGPATTRLEQAGVEYVVAPQRPRLRRRRERTSARAWLGQQLAARQCGLQHSLMAWTHVLATPAARHAGVPAVWFQHNRALRRSMLEWMAARTPCATVFVNSRFTLQAQSRMNRRTPMELVQPPIEPPRHVARDTFRTQIGITDELLVTVCGRLLHSKGQDMALRALDRVPDTMHLAFVGDTTFGVEPHFRRQLEDSAASFLASDRVHFTGFQSDMGPVYAASDIILHTSRLQETFGLVVAEAKAYGCTIVATNRGAIPELIRDGVNGILFEPDDVATLAGVLRRLAEDPDERSRLGATARNDPLVTPDIAAQQLETTYDRILDR